MKATFNGEISYVKMMRNRFLKIPVTTVMTILGAGVVLILLTISIVGLFGGALKEVFYIISSSQAFSTKSTGFNPNPVNVLITQE
jgi:hypothetical protein